MQEIGNWKDKWLLHPFPNMSEPEKRFVILLIMVTMMKTIRHGYITKPPCMGLIIFYAG